MIFVTGCARSGTSVTTKILQALGCDLGSPVNSLFENAGIRETIIKPFLRDLNVDPLGQLELPDTENVPDIPRLRQRVSEHFFYHPRAFKDAKLVLVWPAFHRAFPEAKWVIVRRDGDMIAESCKRTNFMFKRGEWSGWVKQHESLFGKMKATLDAIEVWTDDYMKDVEKFRPVADFLGLDFDPVKVRGCINASKWHDA